MPTGIYNSLNRKGGVKGKSGVYLRTKPAWNKGMKGIYTGEKSSNWKGGKIFRGKYIYIKKPEHPNSGKQGYIAEHRLVMEKHLGRYLTKKEVVHHINEIRDDNRIENLKVFKNNGKHLKLHFSKLGGYVPLWSISDWKYHKVNATTTLATKAVATPVNINATPP